MEYPLSRGHAAMTRRRQLLGRVAGAAVAFALALLPAPRAQAYATIGQVSSSAAPTACQAGYDYLQPSVTAGANLYTAREAGTISSWSTYSTSIGTPAYTLKIFRRTSDPDVFKVISHAQPRVLSAGLNVVPVSPGLHVESGDMIGFNESGSPNSCAFSAPGDSVLRASGNLADGGSAAFSTQDDVRLNLSATLVPSNDFRLAGVARNRRFGTANLTVDLSNPGTATLTGKEIRKRHASRSIPVAGPVTFAIAPAASTLKRLNRRGTARVRVTVTFTPPDGDPNGQSITIALKKRRSTVTTA